MPQHVPPQVGAPDPELRNSPIIDEDDEEGLDPDLEGGNRGVAMSMTSPTYSGNVLSGDELLHCEERGIWVRQSELRPK